MRKLLAVLAFSLLSSAALAQNVTNHAVPIGRGPGVSGFGVGGPCAAGQTLIWSGPTVDPTCQTPSAAGGITVGSSAITGGVTQQVLYDNGGVLGEITKANNSILVTSGTGVPSWATSLPAGFTISLSANSVALSSLAQVAARSVLGNKTASTGNVTAAWTVPNSTDSVIPLVTGALVANNAACLSDTLGTLKDCGLALGSGASATTGTSGHTIPFLDGTNTWSATQTFAAVSTTDLTITGPITVKVRVTTTSPVTISNTTDYLICNLQAGSTATTVNLPPSPSIGDTYVVKDCKGDDATNNITVTPAGTDKIDSTGTGGAGSNYVMKNSSAVATPIFFDRAAFTWSGNATVGWIVN